ncbi:flagellar motor protein MotB [Paludicola sp. MB14-C6]|uniref:OmpA/MotB family protein n=1 Tax=Paludihabitans sp. MB14-C6 TaxID=3070656 RepID=UPI0027DE396A|nr:flagellar motor protein MotB [Paludicola sp. MB14-C6]WMJ24007.1 flagellar motor protein MotB [Paludicola sp. MB14-C6]
MKKKRRQEEEGHANGERWLLTYSDLITLLLALFIIMYTMSSVDLDKFKELSKYLSLTFHATGSNETASGELPNPQDISNAIKNANSSSKEQTTSSENKNSNNSNSNNNTAVAVTPPNALDEIYQEINTYIQANQLDSKIGIVRSESELKITLKDTILFIPDSPTMLPDSKPILETIDKSLNKVYEKIDHITISGHTADFYNEGNKSSAFAWALSTNRAVTVLNFLKDNGLPESKLSIEGYSHFKPIAENNTEAGRAKNRRVEITIRKEGVKNTKPNQTATSSSETSSTNTTSSSNK